MSDTLGTSIVESGAQAEAAEVLVEHATAPDCRRRGAAVARARGAPAEAWAASRLPLDAGAIQKKRCSQSGISVAVIARTVLTTATST